MKACGLPSGAAIGTIERAAAERHSDTAWPHLKHSKDEHRIAIHICASLVAAAAGSRAGPRVQASGDNSAGLAGVMGTPFAFLALEAVEGHAGMDLAGTWQRSWRAPFVTRFGAAVLQRCGAVATLASSRPMLHATGE
jgi:hypothetical protein